MKAALECTSEELAAPTWLDHTSILGTFTHQLGAELMLRGRWEGAPLPRFTGKDGAPPTLQEIIERCNVLNLRMDRPVDQAQRDALVLVTVQTMNYLHGGYHRVAL